MAKIKLNNKVKTIEVFYDGRCAMCCTFMGWLEKQKRSCELISLDYQSEEALEVFPDLLAYHPEKEIVVRMDGEEIYQGGEGWVCCLWSCAKYRNWARRMNGCVLLPMAKKICYFISKNRLGVSRMFFRKKNEEIKCKGGCKK